jgi:hypothetical protein
MPRWAVFAAVGVGLLVAYYVFKRQSSSSVTPDLATGNAPVTDSGAGGAGAGGGGGSNPLGFPPVPVVTEAQSQPNPGETGSTQPGFGKFLPPTLQPPDASGSNGGYVPPMSIEPWLPPVAPAPVPAPAPVYPSAVSIPTTTYTPGVANVTGSNPSFYGGVLNPDWA